MMWLGDAGTGGWWWMGMGWTTMVLFWGAVIGLVFWGVRRLSDRPQATPGPAGQGRSPLEIAQERYAQGGIGLEQLERIRTDLAR